MTPSVIGFRVLNLMFQLLGGLILAPVVSEFQFQGPFLSLALNIGLFIGAVFWGLGCDIWGRRFVLLNALAESFLLTE